MGRHLRHCFNDVVVGRLVAQKQQCGAGRERHETADREASQLPRPCARCRPCLWRRLDVWEQRRHRGWRNLGLRLHDTGPVVTRNRQLMMTCAIAARACSYDSNLLCWRSQNQRHRIGVSPRSVIGQGSGQVRWMAASSYAGVGISTAWAAGRQGLRAAHHSMHVHVNSLYCVPKVCRVRDPVQLQQHNAARISRETQLEHDGHAGNQKRREHTRMPCIHSCIVCSLGHADRQTLAYDRGAVMK